MDIKSLFESSLLNDETKTVLKEAWETAIEANRTEIEAEYAQKLNEAKAELASKTQEMIEEALSEQITSIAEELADARSIEVQYAEKLQQFKESYAEKTEETIQSLVEQQVASHMDEMRDDIEFAKQHRFGMEIFESFKDSYAAMFGEPDVNIHQELNEAKQELETLRREKIINGLLESVTGDKKEVVATILEGVSTDKLEAKFETLRPIILKETTNEDGDKVVEGNKEKVEGKIILENDQGNNEDNADDAVMARIQRSLRLIK